MIRSTHLDRASIVVVGAGVIGTTVAYRLAQAGGQVTVVDRGALGSGTSGRTFAHANGTGKAPRDYQRLNMAGIRALEELEDEVGGRWLHLTGALHWADPADPSRGAALRETARQMTGWGTRVDRLSREEALGLEPALAIDQRVGEVFRVDRAGWAETIPMITATVAAAARFGATVVRGDVTGVRASGGLIEAVVLADGRAVSADLVVNAAGPDAADVATLAGGRVPLQRSAGLLATTLPVPAALGHVVYGPTANLRPDGGNRVMLQATSLDGDVMPGEEIAVGDPRLGRLMDMAAHVMPALRDAIIASAAVGVRPLPPDGVSIVGFDDTVGNLYHVVTHSGVTLAARLADLIAQELTGGDPEPLAPYRPSRFGASRVLSS